MLGLPRSAPSVGRALARVLIALGLVAVSCGEPSIETPAIALRALDTTGPANVDLLFMIDDSSGMSGMQQKLADQIPTIFNVLQNLPTAPNLHVAVISSDLGAPGDSPALTGCTSAGDEGVFQAKPRGNCSDTTLATGAAFISNVDGVPNYLAPDISTVLQCIVPLGAEGCGFGHPLASIARALGADDSPTPAANADFLRADAMLAIVILSDEDDCSAPASTVLYSLNGGNQNLTNALGPIAHYRCNEFGHLCFDSHDPGALIQPPEMPPADAQGTPAAPTFELSKCQSNDTDGLLTPVSTLVRGIKALKLHPDSQIFVSAIVAPAAPYAVAWAPPVNGQDTTPGELWPQIEHACDETTNDGSFGDPAVRITQFVQAFGDNGTVASICDASYAAALSKLVDKLETSATVGDGGGAGIGGFGDGGAAILDAGGSSAMGTGGTNGPSATAGRSGSGQVPGDGLRDGCGCDVGRDGASASGLGLLLACVIVVRRRRASAR